MAIELKPGQVLEVKDWQETFEKSDARKLKVLTWVSTPTDFASTGLQMLFDEFGPERAALLYGVWSLLIKVAATSSHRGRLCGSRGVAYSTAALSRMTMGVPAELLDEFIEWAVTKSRWLAVTESSVLESSEDFREFPRISENLPTTGPDRTQPDPTQPTGRPVRTSHGEFPDPDPAIAGNLSARIATVLGIRRQSQDLAAAVWRSACWICHMHADPDRREALVNEFAKAVAESKVSSGSVGKPHRLLFAICRARSGDQDAFAAAWDATRVPSAVAAVTVPAPRPGPKSAPIEEQRAAAQAELADQPSARELYLAGKV